MTHAVTYKFTFFGWFTDQASFDGHVYRRRSAWANKWEAVKVFGCCACAILVLAATAVWGASALRGVYAIFCSAIPLLSIGLIACLAVFFLRRESLCIDLRDRTVRVLKSRSSRSRSVPFTQIQKLYVRHGVCDRGETFEFICSIKPTLERPSPEDSIDAPAGWRRAYEIKITGDDIAQWIGCPVEHDYSGN